MVGFTSTVQGSNWFEIIPDEVFLEILARLPNAQSVFKCATVSKRWSSLISLHKQYLLSSTTTIVFGFSSDQSQPFHELSPDRSSVSNLVLDFLPHEYWENAVCRASCEDLLLVSQDTSTETNYLLCNPFSKSWTVLPELIGSRNKNGKNRVDGYGLSIGPNFNRKECITVVIFHNFHISILRPRAKQWVTVQLPYMRIFDQGHAKPGFEIVSTSSGAMYWLDGFKNKFTGIVEYDHRTNKGQLIRFPCGSRTIAKSSRPSRDTILLGVVNGRLRLSRIIKMNKTSICLKIWEREEETEEQNGRWALISKAPLKKATHAFVLAMHPTDGNEVFVVCNQHILSLDLRKNASKLIGDLPCHGEALSDIKKKVASFLKAFPLVRSLFPTSLQ